MTSPLRLGIFGGASEGYGQQALELATQVGSYAAKQGLILVTGATHGIPHAAAIAALAAGGTVIGISPAHNAQEHVELYGKPLDGATHIIWTGLGYTGRNFLNLRNCDTSIFIGGGAGTLEEFCVAIYDGQVIGVLTNSGGVADLLPVIVNRFQNHHGSQFIFGTEPEALVDEVIRTTKARR